MALVQPGLFHRLALVVDDVTPADEWYRRIMGCVPVAATERPHQDQPVENVLDLDGATSQMLWHGGLPLILLGVADRDGPVGRFMARWGAGLHSLAWEIDDMWTVEHLLRQKDIRITGVNIPGRHFFMHPADTDGVLMEWTDTIINGDPRRGLPVPAETAGVVGGVQGIGWVTAVVADADATAARLVDLAAAEEVTGNPAADPAVERTIDVAVGDVTMRLITPRSDASRHVAVLERGPRLWSYAVRVPDLDAALDGLAGEGIKVLDRDGSIAWTDPATTLGVPIEWTDASAP
jgi:catechol 2,3-dioxygenase-like lactoylglutathione lyase family enzyme